MDNFNFKIGETIVVENDNENCLIGELYKVTKDKKRMQLKNVRDFKTSSILLKKGVQIFYSTEIRSIRSFDDADNNYSSDNKKSLNDIDDDDEITSINDCSTNINSISNNCNNNLNTTSPTSYFSMNQLNEINSIIETYKYITEIDATYYLAIADINQQDYIGVMVEGAQSGRLLSHTSIITIATKQTIYIFDIICFGKIFNDLKLILESKTICKIIHNSNFIADNLFHLHGIELQTIFDTMVAHISLEGNSKTSITDINTCIQKYFKLPTNCLSCPTIPPQQNWTVRPLSDELKILTAQNCVYLLKLYSYFLNDHFLKKFHLSCDNFSNSLKKNNDTVDIAMVISYNRNDCIKDIENFELPITIPENL